MTFITTSLYPPAVPSEKEVISYFQPLDSMYLVYMRIRSPAKMAASSPPVPPRISTIAFSHPAGPVGINRSLISSSRVFDLRFQFRDLPACHFAHLLVLVVGQDVFGFGQVGDGRAVAFRGFDDRFQLPVFLVELDELLDVGDHFGIGEFLADLFVFELQTVQSGEYGIVCHINLIWVQR